MLSDESTPRPILRATNGRDVDLRRDALTGSPAEQERHRVARMVLLQLLYDRLVGRYFREKQERGRLGAVNAEAIAAYEALAAEGGLPDRGALWQDSRYSERRDAIFLAWAEAILPLLDAPDPESGNWVPWGEMDFLAHRVAAGLQVSPAWLSLELQEMLLWALAVYTMGRGLRSGYERDVLGTTLSLRLQPGESEAAFLERARAERLRAVMAPVTTTVHRMPKDHAYIKQNVEWLVRHRLDGLTQGQLAREYKATRPDLASDGRRQVQEGIARAREWLNAAGVAAKAGPIPEPAVIGPDPAFADLPPLVREMAERLPATAETVAGLEAFMRRVAQGPRTKKATSKTKTVRTSRKRNRRR